MTEHKTNGLESAPTEHQALTPLTERSAKEASISLQEPSDSIFDQSVRQIKCQEVSNIVFDLLRGGQAPQGFLLNTLATIDRDCVPAFLEQLSKRIRGST